MKKLFLSGVAALLLVSGAAHARMRTSLPPAEYDKPYEGELTIRRLATEQEIRTACPKVNWQANYQSHATACSLVWNATRCDIYIVGDRALKAADMNYNVALRHELGHCNGWPGDHKGGKKVFVDLPVTVPKLPLSTKFLPAYPPVVCVTPDWNREPCENRETKDIWSTARPFQIKDLKR